MAFFWEFVLLKSPPTSDLPSIRYIILYLTLRGGRGREKEWGERERWREGGGGGGECTSQLERENQPTRETDRQRQNTEYGNFIQSGHNPIWRGVSTINLVMQWTHSIQFSDVGMLQMNKADAKRYVEENITILSMIINSSHSYIYVYKAFIRKNNNLLLCRTRQRQRQIDNQSSIIIIIKIIYIWSARIDAMSAHIIHINLKQNILYTYRAPEHKHMSYNIIQK